MKVMKYLIVLMSVYLVLFTGCENNGQSPLAGIQDDPVISSSKDEAFNDYRRHRINISNENVKSLPNIGEINMQTMFYLHELLDSLRAGKSVESVEDLYLAEDELEPFHEGVTLYRQKVDNNAELLLIDQIMAVQVLDRFLLTDEGDFNSASLSPKRLKLIDHYTSELLRTEAYDVRVWAKSLEVMAKHWPEDRLVESIDYAISVAEKFEWKSAGKSELSKDTGEYEMLPVEIRANAERDTQIRTDAAVNVLESLKQQLELGNTGE